jgi:predicted nucleic acid-binding protein
MKDPVAGPYLFDTSAEVRLSVTRDPASVRWFQAYLAHYPVHVSAVTVIERVRGYALLWHQAAPELRAGLDARRISYLNSLQHVEALDIEIAIVAAEIMALLPRGPAQRKRSHRLVENRQSRLSRWRFDVMIAATALVKRMTLVHNNAEDFEAIRSAIERSPQRFPKLGPLELVRCNALA